MKQLAVEYFKKGYSCSESIVQAAIDKGYLPQEFLSVASPFSGGMSVRCLCGAISGAHIVIGYLFGKSSSSDGLLARSFAKEFNESFAKSHKANCCKVLSAGFDFHSPERKSHCLNLIFDSAQILEDIIKKSDIKHIIS